MALLLSMLASCSGGGTDGTGDGEEEDEPEDQYAGPIIYGDEILPLFIMAEDLSNDNRTVVYQGIKTAYGTAPDYAYDTELDQTANEIVVGRTSRDISVKAYRKLERVEREYDYSVRYLVYAEGGSVAVAFDNDGDGIGATVSCAEFVTRVLSDNKTLALKEGCVVNGNLHIKRLSVELGSTFNGNCRMITEAEFDKISGAETAKAPAQQQARAN